MPKNNFKEPEFQVEFDRLFLKAKYKQLISTLASTIDSIIVHEDDPFHIIALIDLKTDEPDGRCYFTEPQVVYSGSIWKSRLLFIIGRQDRRSYIIMNAKGFNTMHKQTLGKDLVNINWLDVINGTIPENKIRDEEFKIKRVELERIVGKQILLLNGIPNLKREIMRILDDIREGRNPFSDS